MKRDASPGPNGLNVAFYLLARRWISDDVTRLVQDFYIKGKLLNKYYPTGFKPSRSSYNAQSASH